MKKPYVKPRLTEIGTISDLTRGGGQQTDQVGSGTTIDSQKP